VTELTIDQILATTIPADTMPCGHVDRWWDITGRERCYACHGKPYPHTGRLLADVEALRKKRVPKRKKVTI
jgi:hypothetical protein